ncbi:KpsF/GutQ family sugar-phosphate isomerase [Lentibacillus sediminis]|uniref:KpsF/GutQ family sugar-phosphate isomerase n=1 Tax=Lentibacillus sediminis TaxID=1940529 RepID=UPI001EFC8D81|nr:SIS domain-containing protein [Lentibacillus sediminis]
MNTLNFMRNVIELEAEAIKDLTGQIEGSFEKVVELLTNCNGKVIVTGVGKSGHVGKKIAASLASTGTPSFFVHSTEGVHGDLGMITKEDIVLLISNSGETGEVLALLPSLQKIGVKKVAITSSSVSTLAENSDAVLAYRYKREADHLGVAPTVSSTIVLVIGDLLATSISHSKEFTKQDFHLYHPGGSLGKQLLNDDGGHQ